MSYQPQFTITPSLLARVENIAALREKILAATVFALLIAILVSIVRRALHVLHHLSPADETYASRIVGLIAAVASLLVAFLATSGFSLGYSWMILGLLGAYCRVLEQRSS